MARKPNFTDLARLAGVSIATVSRLANSSARVSPEIEEKVKRAAEELGINLYAGDRSKVVGFLLSNRPMLHPFHSHVLAGTESYCAARGWNVLFLTFSYSASVSSQELRLPLLERRDMVSGFIVAGTNSNNLLDLLNRKRIPYAVLGNNVVGEWRSERSDVVWFDDVQGATEVTRYVVSLGHRDIWFVGNTRLPWFARRYEGYCRAMQEVGLPPRLSGIDSNDERNLGLLATKSILARREPLSAIFAGDDATAKGVYSAVRDMSMSIPEDISVVGFNDIEAGLLHPALTTVRVFTEEIGKHLAEAVLRRIENRRAEPQQFTIHTQLIKRESCRTLSETKELVPTEPSSAPILTPIH